MSDSAGTVLVVDDDQDLLDLVSFVLEDAGYEVATATDGRLGLAAVAVAMPGLILLDMKMPVMNGWQFAEAFRAAYDQATPIVVLTAADDAKRRAEEIGAVGWIGKPFDLDELIAAVARHIVHRA